ncbi:LOW QUALITY PROTEIN: hypothetical protein OSB04_031898 [Centaurea solstitialis]|uniref:Reverse transcriptase Ty1/copia-type domain-containing protein n=1 Tax=Centaurea solstitialis TaxID=347529 RepID=A0AA38W567_9ASTR|nr:LOW QUALITY PROTEIN: hypothetical protein OSB04_031898 [Centaurea solstitialis]
MSISWPSKKDQQDDIIFGSTKEEMCKAFEELMHKKFKMSSMGELTFFLGLQVKQKSDGIFINQSKYVASMLQKFGMSYAKPTSTPMETHKHLTADVEGEEVDFHNYRSMIGSLMYLTASRPDIMFAVCVCARYQAKESHLHAVKRIFKYLKGQPTLGLWYPNDSSFDLVAYTDSDYGGANLDRKSTSGGCQFLGGRLVSWQCKKQTTISQSTTEAEYITASHCCSQVLWIQNQMLDYGLSFLQTPIYIDNNSLKVHTHDQFADLFTKAFDVGRFTFLVTSFGGRGTEKYGKRRENVKNAQSQSSSLLAIAKIQVWRRQIRQVRNPGFDQRALRREKAVWRSRNGL